MGLFSNKRTQQPAVIDDDSDDTGFAHQGAVTDLLDDFHHLDLAFLATLTPAQRTEQEQARSVMYQYADAMWDDLKRRGLEPADNPTQYNSVAAMRDLTSELRAHIEQAQEIAGDDTDD